MLCSLATAVIEPSSAQPSSAQRPSDSLPATQAALVSHPLNVEHYYQSLREQGLAYGPQFRPIQQLWQQQGKALSQLALQDSAHANYCIHPALLDGCFQTIGAAILQEAPTESAAGTYLPVGVDRFQFYRPLGAAGWCLVTAGTETNHTPDVLKVNLTLWDATGSLAAVMTGMTLKQVGRPTLQRLFGDGETSASVAEAEAPKALESWLYELVWRSQVKEQSSATVTNRSWIVFADAQGIGDQLAKALRAEGDRCFMVTPTDSRKENNSSQTGPLFQAAETDKYSIDPSTPEAFNQLLSTLTPTLIAEQQGKLDCQLLYLWGLDASNEASELQTRLQEKLCGGLLHLVQAIAQFPALTARLSVVTKQAQSVEVPTPLQLQQTTLWGMARSLRLEHPKLACTCIDLDPLNTESNQQQLLADLTYPDKEDQIAYRQDQRFVARLASHEGLQAARLSVVSRPDNLRLGLTQYGTPDDLAMLLAPRSALAAGEVEIRVRAGGLNFRDVLNSLGMLKSVAESMGFRQASEVPFGGECAGVIAAVGTGVSDLRVGDEVLVAQAMGSLRQFITVPSTFVVPKPQEMTFADAATIPTTFLTAYYGLVHCAKLKKGDRILIHTAAGGVGQAAVQIAQQIGAEIFATASPPKWSFLKQMGIDHVMHSRTLNFAEQIKTATAGQGVDV
ncbi:MAG: polyketide synthase dehydratase domain-containing protein, partial [Cyanobacteria bacterium J06576_12]